MSTAEETAGRLTARRFEAADGAEDWRVVAYGPRAWYRTRGYLDGAAFVERVAPLDTGAYYLDLDVRRTGVGAHLGRRQDEPLDHGAVELARQVSTAARELGLAPDPSMVQCIDLTTDVTDVAEVRPFWVAALAYDPLDDADVVDPQRRWSPMWFQELDAPRPLRNRIHLDLAVPAERADERVAAALAAGGRVTIDRPPAQRTVADGEGNEVCLSSWEGRGRWDPVTQAFHETVGQEDWRVTIYDGGSAFYRTGSRAQSARLVSAVVALAGVQDAHLALDVRDDGVTVRTRTEGDDFWGLSQRDAEVARQVQDAARELGAEPDPSRLQCLQLTIDARDREAVKPFWRAVLGYEDRPCGDEDLRDPRDQGPTIWFQDIRPELDPRHEERARQRNRVHVDVYVPAELAKARLDAAIAAGGRIVYDAEAPEWWTLADPEGNEADVGVIPGREEIWMAAQETGASQSG